jgi:hypothetical protein
MLMLNSRLKVKQKEVEFGKPHPSPILCFYLFPYLRCSLGWQLFYPSQFLLSISPSAYLICLPNLIAYLGLKVLKPTELN